MAQPRARRRRLGQWPRLAMVLAVLEARCGIPFAGLDVYLKRGGGIKLSDPAADLAVAAALVSALADKPLPARSVWLGEVSLAGEIRSVAHAALRLREAAKLGFERGFGPRDVDHASAKLQYHEVGQLPILLDRVMGGA